MTYIVKGAVMSEKKNERFSLERVEYDPVRMIRAGLPVIAAMMLFLMSAGYIAYRMMSSYNYNKRWKDYDECGLS